jgi:hypothetical protein
MDVAATDIDYQRPVRAWKPERCDRIALVLQGGGALGAYQAGVFQALSEADIEPDWVTGAHCSPEPLAAIVPATPDDNTCVVETGSPYISAAAIVPAATTSAQAPWP